MSELHDPLLMLAAWIDHWRDDVKAGLGPTINALNSAAKEIESAKNERAEVLYHLDGAKRGWRTISADAKTQARMLLCWKAFSGLPAHVFRHSAACLMAESGTPMSEIAQVRCKCAFCP